VAANLLQCHTKFQLESHLEARGDALRECKAQLVLFNTKQSVYFAANTPRSFQERSKFWLLMRGVILWSLWIARNDLVFNHVRWFKYKIEQIIWQGFTNYGRGDWVKTLDRITKKPSTAEKALAKFDDTWACHESICSRQGMRVRWKTFAPTGIG
jgi:hypothetical protein